MARIGGGSSLTLQSTGAMAWLGEHARYCLAAVRDQNVKFELSGPECLSVPRAKMSDSLAPGFSPLQRHESSLYVRENRLILGLAQDSARDDIQVRIQTIVAHMKTSDGCQPNVSITCRACPHV